MNAFRVDSVVKVVSFRFHGLGVPGSGFFEFRVRGLGGSGFRALGGKP